MTTNYFGLRSTGNSLDYSLRIRYNNTGDSMKTRSAKLIVNKSGGTASEKSKTYRITLPNTWIKQLGLGEANREVELSFDGVRIIMNQPAGIEDFIKANCVHKLLKLEYYNFDKLCTTIIADYTDKKIKIQNHTENNLYTAFGAKQSPGWQDYSEFLEDRCIPKTRAGLQKYLDQIGVEEYDPLEIIKKTNGRMAEDNQWMEVTEL